MLKNEYKWNVNPEYILKYENKFELIRQILIDQETYLR